MWDIRFLQLAALTASWSKDPSTKVGAVITRPDRTVASLGYNGFPRGVVDSAERYEDRELKYKMIVHAELNAILTACEPLHGYILYTWPFMPCACCAGAVIQSGIKRVVSIEADNPRWAESFRLTKQLFCEADVELHLVPSDKS
jgi:dCMP deaminase